MRGGGVSLLDWQTPVVAASVETLRVGGALEILLEQRHQMFLLHNIILVQRKGIESVTCCFRTENQAANSEPMPFASAKYLGTPKLA